MADQAQYVDQRRIGAATITLISDGVLPLPLTDFFPEPEAAWLRAHAEVDEQDRVLSGQAVILVQIGDATVVIDPAFDDPDSTWQRAVAAGWGTRRTPGMAAGMTSVGVRPETVTHVVISHAHIDHFAGVIVERDGRDAIRFPNARHFIGRPDWEANQRRDEPEQGQAERLGPIDRAGLLYLVDGDQEVAPGVTMLHAPGESPGHCVVRIDSAGERFYALGDLCHHPCEVAHPDWIAPRADQSVMRTTRARFFSEVADVGATVVFTHDPFPQWGCIVPAGDGYRFEHR